MNKEKILGIITIIIFGVFIYALFFITPEFKVTFNENNGSDAVSYYTVKRGETVSKPKEPVKEGYTLSIGLIRVKSLILIQKYLRILH